MNFDHTVYFNEFFELAFDTKYFLEIISDIASVKNISENVIVGSLFIVRMLTLDWTNMSFSFTLCLKIRLKLDILINSCFD